MSHPTPERLVTFLRELPMRDAALVGHLLRCPRCGMKAALEIAIAPVATTEVQAPNPTSEAHERYAKLFTRLVRNAEKERESFARARTAAEGLLRDLLRPPSNQARLAQVRAKRRFHQPALAALLLTMMPESPEERRDHAQLALAILDEASESRKGAAYRASLRAGAYIALGDALRELGDLAGADAALFFVPEFVEQTGDVLDAADFCRALGEVRRDQERRDEAIALLARASDLYEDICQSAGEVRTRVGLGELCLEAGEPSRALEAFLSALRFGPEILPLDLAEEALERGAECWLLLEGPEAAQGWLAGMREIFREAPEAGSSLDLGTPAAAPVHEEAP